MNEVHRLAAFSGDPSGGNPAGVVPDARGLSDDDMLQIAANVGFSETAFLVDAGNGLHDVRYFSPLAEVPFCGHATIASGVLLGPGEWVFATQSGDVGVDVTREDDGLVRATLTSVHPRVNHIADDDLAELLPALGWAVADLDPTMPPRVAYAGAYHPILAAREHDRLSRLDYDVDRLRALMLARDWTTIDLVWRESVRGFHARNPFPVGGVYEDPATGAAAAAFGAYLRNLGVVEPPATVTIHQGSEMGRPSTLLVELRADDDRIRVSGTAVHIPPGDEWRPRPQP
jgi:PhzF family phenazine biosynthesis protein